MFMRIRNALARCKWIIAACAATLFLVCMILLIVSFSYIDYDEFGLRKNEVSNDVETNKVYGHGRYLWGPNFKVVRFPALHQTMEFSFDVFVEGGFVLSMDVFFKVGLQMDRVGEMYNEFGKAIMDQVATRANARIKNEAPHYSLDDYVENRANVTAGLHHELVDELDALGLNLPRDLFFVLATTLPSEVWERNLEAALRNQATIQEQHHKDSARERQETRRQVELRAAEIARNVREGDAQSMRIVQEAQTDEVDIVTRADAEGMGRLFARAGIEDEALRQFYIMYYSRL